MKKKILGGLLVVAIAAVAAFNVNMNTEKNELSMLALANVEALASNESADPECRLHLFYTCSTSSGPLKFYRQQK